MRRFLLSIASFAGLISLSCSDTRNLEAGSSKYSDLIALVDAISVPIPDDKLGDDVDGGAVEGKPSIKLAGANAVLPGGASASLIGTKETPLAVVIYSHADIETYYLPFSGVTDIDRPRRLTKLADRVYRIESNRSSEGSRVEQRLP